MNRIKQPLKKEQGKHLAGFSAYYRKLGIKDLDPTGITNLEEVYEKVTTDTHLASLINDVRKASPHTDAYRKAKGKLPYITPSGTFTERGARHLVGHSNLICIDIDVKPATKDKPAENHGLDIKEARERIIRDTILNPILVFTSPGGNGLKVFLSIDVSQYPFINWFKACQKYFEERHKIDIDKSCSDVSRACFLSHDPKAYFKANNEVVNLPESYLNPPKQEAQRNEQKTTKQLKTPKTYSNNTYQGITEDDKIEYCIQQLEVKGSDITSNYNDWLSIGFSFASLGESGRAHFHRVSKIHSDYKFNECDKKFTNLLKKGRGSYSIATFFKFCKEEGILFKDILPKRAKKKDVVLEDKQQSPQEEQETQKLEAFKELDFPLEAFPKEYQEMVKAFCISYGFDQDMFSFAILNAVAGSIGGSVMLRNGNFLATSTLYGVIVAPPSSSKSLILKKALQPITARDSEYQDKNAQEYSEWLEECKSIKKGQEKPTKPRERHLYVSDTSIEGMYQVISENPRGVIYKSDEMAKFLGDLTRYNTNATSDYLSFWSNTSTKIVRKQSSSIHIEKPYLNILGCIQNDVVHSLAGGTKGKDGFLFRIIFCFGKKTLPPSYEDANSIENKERIAQNETTYNQYLCKIMDLDVGHEMKLSPDADKVWGRFIDEMNLKVFNESNPVKSSYLGKYQEITSRLALIIQMMYWSVDRGELEECSDVSVNSAITLAHYLMNQMEKALDVIEVNNESTYQEARERFTDINWKSIFKDDDWLGYNEIVRRIVDQGKISKTSAKKRVKFLKKHNKTGKYTYRDL